MEHILNRVERCRAVLAEKKLDGLILVNDEKQGWVNLFYLSGFQGTSGALLITQKEALLTTDSRYTLQASKTSPLELKAQKGSLMDVVEGWVKDFGLKRVGFDGAFLSAAKYLKFLTYGPEWVNFADDLALLRRKKDAVEVAAIRKAADIAAAAYLETLPLVKPGMKEAEFAKLVELAIARHDGEGVWHDGGMIVASGVRSSLPHGRASTKTFALGEQVTVDYGSIYHAYQSDITRNFSLGPLADPLFEEIHAILYEAHTEAAKALRPGVRGCDVDAIARNIIKKAGYGDFFGHGLGHSFGIEIHESPRLSPLYEGELREGDTITVEPGIYLPDRGGLRLEDDYIITADGAERLTSALPQEFVHLDL